jgi:hypothetical protein
MSIEMQTNTTHVSPSARVQRGTPLTAANLAVREREISPMPSNQAVREWLAMSGNSDRRNLDMEAWMQLIERDPVAAAIEAATHNAKRRE